MPAEVKDVVPVTTPISLYPEGGENGLTGTEIPPTKTARLTTVRLTGHSPAYAILATKTAGYGEGYQTADSRLYAEKTKTAYSGRPAPWTKSSCLGASEAVTTGRWGRDGLPKRPEAATETLKTATPKTKPFGMPA